MSSLLAILKQAGRRITAPRRAMAGVLDAHSGQHLSAREIRSILRRRGVKVNLASVYRNLSLLESLGAIHRGGLPHAHNHYELQHGGEVHLVCTGCGALIEAAADTRRVPLKWLRSFAGRRGFAISGFQIEARGLCTKCTKAGRKRND